MADGRDLVEALDMSWLRLNAVEEQLIISIFSNIEKRISSFIANESSPKEIREPYEFN